MRGELGSVVVDQRSMEPLERVQDGRMPLGSATRRGAVVECVPDQFMLEVVPIIAAPLERLDERRLQSLIQGAKKALFPCVRQYRRHNPKLELASDDGGNDEDLIGERREPAQSLRDCRAHVLGDGARFNGRQPRDLRHEERVPAGSRVNQLDHLGRRLLAGDTRHELPRVFRGQPTQGDPGDPHARELAKRLRQRRPNLAVPIGRHDQHSVAGKLLGDELEEQQRVLISPMKILENKQNWRLHETHAAETCARR